MGRHAMYVQRYAKNNHIPIDFAVFTKALWTDGWTNQQKDQPTDRRTDQPTSYRDVIAASKNKHYSCAVAMEMRYISCIKSKEARRGTGIHKWSERRKDARS